MQEVSVEKSEEQQVWSYCWLTERTFRNSEFLPDPTFCYCFVINSRKGIQNCSDNGSITKKKSNVKASILNTKAKWNFRYLLKVVFGSFIKK